MNTAVVHRNYMALQAIRDTHPGPPMVACASPVGGDEGGGAFLARLRPLLVHRSDVQDAIVIVDSWIGAVAITDLDRDLHAVGMRDGEEILRLFGDRGTGRIFPARCSRSRACTN